MNRFLTILAVFSLTFVLHPGKADAANLQTETAASEITVESGTQRLLVPDATSNNYAGKQSEPIFGVQTDKPQIALSFDAGADRGKAGAIMDVLEKYNLKSTFFLTGDWIEENLDDAKSIVARGHELGNHSVSHPEFTKLTVPQMNQQIQDTHKLVKKLLGVEMCLFRAPYGDYNTTVIDTIKNNKYYCIQWTVDSIDWRDEGRDIIVDRVLNHKDLGNGAIILMHIGAAHTPSALDEIIQTIQARGYEIVPVSELIYEKNYHMNYMGIQIPN